jgi:hypothetical protein
MMKHFKEYENVNSIFNLFPILDMREDKLIKYRKNLGFEIKLTKFDGKESENNSIKRKNTMPERPSPHKPKYTLEKNSKPDGSTKPMAPKKRGSVALEVKRRGAQDQDEWVPKELPKVIVEAGAVVKMNKIIIGDLLTPRKKHRKKKPKPDPEFEYVTKNEPVAEAEPVAENDPASTGGSATKHGDTADKRMSRKEKKVSKMHPEYVLKND